MEYQRVPITCDEHFAGYQIDTNGIVYRKNGKPLVLSSSGRYLLATISVHGVRLTRQVHRLVALQFLPNPLDKPTVNHIDGNHTNNKVDNLEWATQREQMIHARDVLGIKPVNKLRVIGVNIDTLERISFDSCSASARYFGVGRAAIDAVVVVTKFKNCFFGAFCIVIPAAVKFVGNGTNGRIEIVGLFAVYFGEVHCRTGLTDKGFH